MLDIKLVSMPFAGLDCPSIALTQIKSVLEDRYRNAVKVRICYLNLEFGRLLGSDVYDFVASGSVSQSSGLGEWLFSRHAFPDTVDHSHEYFSCYQSLFRNDTAFSKVNGCLLETRKNLNSVLDDLIDRYQLDQADVVGFTSMFQQTCPSVAMALRIRSTNPDQVIVMGGANCEGTMGIELVTNVSVLDFVFSGPSLISFPLFVERLLKGEVDACHHIDGIFSRKNARSANELVGPNDRIEWGTYGARQQLTGIREIGAELDINAPVRLNYDDYLETQGNLLPGLPEISLTFETSRGCWWGERAHCTFCGLNGSTMAYRAMRPQVALDLVNELIQRYAPDRVKNFQCVDNILPKEYVDEVFAKLKPPDDVIIFYEVKADLTERQVATLARAGMHLIQPGIEALATSTLKLMRKGTTAFQNVQLLMYCGKYGVVPVWNLLIGFPGEKPEVYDRYLSVLPSLFHLCPPSSAFHVRFDRYSPYFTQARHYGLELEPRPYYRLCYPFPPAAISNMAYYFVDRDDEAPYRMQANKYLPQLRELIAHWRERFTGRDGRAPARLELLQTSDGVFIEDVRSGTPKKYQLSQEEWRLLVDLQHPIAQRDIESNGNAAVLDGLVEKQLVFSERDRFMSLVISHDSKQERMTMPTRLAQAFAVYSPDFSGHEVK